MLSYEEKQPVTVKICNLNNYPIFISIYADNGKGKFIKIYPPNLSLAKIERNPSNELISAEGELTKSAPYIILTLGTTFVDSLNKSPLPTIHTFKLYITETDQYVPTRKYKVLTRKIEVYPKNHPQLPVFSKKEIEM